jgi:hypothetical protein
MSLLRSGFLHFTLSLSVFIAFFVPSSHADLVLHLTGDGSATDSSGNGHHGTLIGDATFANGVLGSAFLLDGSGDYVAIANHPSLEPTSALSVAAWVSMGPISGIVLIVDSSHGFVDSAGWSLQTSAVGQISFAYGNNIFFPELLSNSEIDDSAFHHVAGVFDGTTMSIYVDGLLENQIAYVGTPQPSGRELRIGASWGGGVTNREVNGLIDDVRVYNHALSATEIRSLVSAVPEPSSLGMLTILGLATLNFRRGQFRGSRVPVTV